MDLQRRVEQLERRCQRLMILVVALLAVGSAAAFIQTNKQPVVRTESLEIVDGNGRVRMRLAMNDADSCGVTLYGTSGRPRLSVLGSDRGSGLNIFQGEQAVGAATLMVHPTGVGLSLRDPQGMLRASLQAGSDGARLEVWNAEGKAVFSAPSPKVAQN